MILFFWYNKITINLHSFRLVSDEALKADNSVLNLKAALIWESASVSFGKLMGCQLLMGDFFGASLVVIDPRLL